MSVPFVDISRIHKPLQASFLRTFSRLAKIGHFVAGEETQLFEKEWAQIVGAKHSTLVNNGTSALFLALQTLELPAGSEVIIPVNTFIATPEAALLANLKPVFVDVDPETYLIDVDAVLKAITKKTRAVIPVNLYGQALNIRSLKKKIASVTNERIFIVEDACQSHGAFWGKTPKLESDLACYSFYPGKNLGALGEAGAVVTNDKTWDRQIKLFRGHGSEIKYKHEIIGFNFRAGEIEAALLRIKLPHLAKYNQSRFDAALYYYSLLQPVIEAGSVRMTEPPLQQRHVYHLLELYVERREELMEFLQKKGIQTGLHYPHPLHLTPAFSNYKYKKGAFSVAEDLSHHLVSLPMFAGITKKEVREVCMAIKQFYADKN
jgi:dTDP-4-amino-4,6-dideoxygalactose transaminase